MRNTQHYLLNSMQDIQKEKRIVIMYYYEGLTMKEIGRILDLTESRVCQIHTNVLQRLREQLNKSKARLMTT